MVECAFRTEVLYRAVSEAVLTPQQLLTASKTVSGTCVGANIFSEGLVRDYVLSPGARRRQSDGRHGKWAGLEPAVRTCACKKMAECVELPRVKEVRAYVKKATDDQGMPMIGGYAS